MDYKYRFTLFVACYNSAKFLHRVFNSVDNFSFRDFELIIVNDASTDNTHEIIEAYIKTAKFPIKYFNREKNAGVIANIALALDNAEGEIFIGMGHDDEYSPKMLETFDALLKKYDSPEIAGIGALCETQHGKLVDFKYPEDVYIVLGWTAFVQNGKLRTECPVYFKTQIFKEYKKKYPNMAYPANIIGTDYKIIFINEIVRTYYVNENPNRLTARSRRDVVKQEGMLAHINYVNRAQYIIKGNFKIKLRLFFQYPFYGCHYGWGLGEMLNHVERTRDKIFVTLMYPFAFALSKRLK